MLLKKIDQGAAFLTKGFQFFCCPLCRQSLTTQNGYQLVCQTGHRFDLAKKGTLYFLSHQIKTDYDKTMLNHRRRMIMAGLYDPLLERLRGLICSTDDQLVVDGGTGEGSFLHKLSTVAGHKIGFDISKDGIMLASDYSQDAFWCVADMTNLPFQTKSVTTFLNILSPSHYAEINRVLTDEGQFIKVIPAENYLTELRQGYYQDQDEKRSYSNQLVYDKFCQSVDLQHRERVTYQFDVSSDYTNDMLLMSPIHWGATDEARQRINQQAPEKLTIDVIILIGKAKKR